MVLRTPPYDRLGCDVTIAGDISEIPLSNGMSDQMRPNWLLEGSQLTGTAGLRSEIRQFLAEDSQEFGWSPRPDSWLMAWDEGFSKRLAGRGWLGMTIPIEFGGTGDDALARFVVTEELLAAGAPVAAHWIADRQTAPQLLKFGTDEQKASLLPRIARGELFTALGLSEPDIGSDLAAVKTHGQRVDGGWRIDGRKIWTSGGTHASLLTALVRTTPISESGRKQAGLTQFFIDLDAPGVEVRPISLINGEQHFAEVLLDGVVVRESSVLGVVGEGWSQVTAELAYERSGPERMMSTLPVLLEFFRSLDPYATGEVSSLGFALARFISLRKLSGTIASELNTGRAPEVPAAMAKDLGTAFEQEVLEMIRSSAGADLDDTSASALGVLYRQAMLQSPGFTIRGGTSEILRTVIARGMRQG